MIKQNGGAAAAALSAVFLSALFLLFPETVADATSRALSLCAARVIPSVFPFSVLSSMFVSSGGGELLDRAVSPLSRRVFGVERGASALMLGLLFGFPLGALTVGAQYRSGTITKDEASRLLAFVCCASPTFPVFVVGRGFFGSTAAGLLIWITQAAVSIAVGALLARLPKKQHQAQTRVSPAADGAGFFVLVTHGVTDASRVILNVCGSVTFFSVVSSVISRLLAQISDSPFLRLAVSALFEFSSGTAAAADACAAGEISRAAALAVCGFAIGFAGLSVMFQTASVCDGIPLLPHLLGKLVCGISTAAVTFALASASAFAPAFSSDGGAYRGGASLPSVLELIPAAVVFVSVVCFACRRSKARADIGKKIAEDGGASTQNI